MSPNACPRCGATLKDDLTCESVFYKFLALEFTDAAYGAVHMLTVACYMIQHDQYSNEALIWMKQRLYDYLEKGTPAEQIRKQVAQELGQEKRNWKITSQKVESQRSKTPWSMTIMDVATQHHDAESYRNCIEKWAATILKEM